MALVIVKNDNFYTRGPAKAIEIIRIPQNVLNRLSPLAAATQPIQNNSDLAVCGKT